MDAPHAPLRVLYVLHTAASSGAGFSLLHLLETLSVAAVRPSVLMPPGPLVARFEALGIPVHQVPGVATLQSIGGVPMRGLRTLELLRVLWCLRHSERVREVLRLVKPDLVHCNERGIFQVAALARTAGIPVIMHARSVADRRTRWVRRLSDRLARRTVSRIVAIDQSVRHSLRELPHVSVVYNPLPAGWRDTPAQPAAGVTRVSFVANLLGYKGIWDLLAAAEALRDRRDILFRIAGANTRSAAFHRSWRGRLVKLFGFAPDTERAVRHFVDTRRLGETVHVLGHVEDLPALYAGTDVLVFPSHLNGPGRSVFEAGARGIPSVVALEDRIEDIVEHERTGLIVPPRAPAELAEAIRRLADDPALRCSLGQAAQRQYREQFAPARVGAAMLAVYRDVLAEHSHAGSRGRAADLVPTAGEHHA